MLNTKPTLQELSLRLREGTTSSRGLVEDCLARLDADDRAYLYVDTRGAREAADAMDRLRQVKGVPSEFAGIPMAVKDLFDIQGASHRRWIARSFGTDACFLRCRHGVAAAQAGLHNSWSHEHDRVCLLGAWFEPAFWLSFQSIGRRKAHCRRVIVGCGGGGSAGNSSHGAWN